MSADVLFPFWEILVNRMFGGVGISLAAVGVIIVVMLGLCRSGWTFILFWMLFYISVTLTFYAGGIGLLVMFIIVAIYLTTQIIRFFYPDR